MKFEWDEEKNIANFEKHNIWFDEAKTIWTDAHALEFFDPEHSEKEDRYIRIGYSNFGKLIFVVFTEISEKVIRIISARKTTMRERSDYEEGI